MISEKDQRYLVQELAGRIQQAGLLVFWRRTTLEHLGQLQCFRLQPSSFAVITRHSCYGNQSVRTFAYSRSYSLFSGRLSARRSLLSGHANSNQTTKPPPSSTAGPPKHCAALGTVDSSLRDSLAQFRRDRNNQKYENTCIRNRKQYGWQSANIVLRWSAQLSCATLFSPSSINSSTICCATP